MIQRDVIRIALFRCDDIDTKDDAFLINLIMNYYTNIDDLIYHLCNMICEDTSNDARCNNY